VRIAVIGVGLIGGSIALGARQRLDAEVTGYDTDHRALGQAVALEALDFGCVSLAQALDGVEAAFVAVPVGPLPQVVADTLAAAPEDCVVSDVGSTKRAVVAAQEDPRFVGGHPLAGAESAGVEHARGDLFDGATWYLTPTATTSGMLYERLHRLLRGLGARPAAIDPATHDSILATVSHLPHVLANVLVAQAAATLGGTDERLPATGPSFRDATRVAGSPSSVWADIYLSNADALTGAVERTIEALQRVRDALRGADAGWITTWNEEAAGHRRRLLEGQLGAGELTELRASVPNRPGVVAQLALELGRAGVNIVDMALYPAPDMTEGVIALWISGQEAARRAQALVAGLGFPVARA
jgi:prephenate dehydrogenase